MLLQYQQACHCCGPSVRVLAATALGWFFFSISVCWGCNNQCWTNLAGLSLSLAQCEGFRCGCTQVVQHQYLCLLALQAPVLALSLHLGASTSAGLLPQCEVACPWNKSASEEGGQEKSPCHVYKTLQSWLNCHHMGQLKMTQTLSNTRVPTAKRCRCQSG